jgi:CHASE3 domain sensor protein
MVRRGGGYELVALVLTDDGGRPLSLAARSPGTAMRTGLTTRLLVAGGLLVATFMAAFISMFVALQDAEISRRTVANSEKELAAAREIRSLLTEMESAQRGFIITADTRMLEPWEDSRRELPPKLAQLNHIADDPTQKIRAAQLEVDALAYVENYALSLMDASRRGDQAANDMVTEDGERLMNGLSRQLDTYSATEESLIREEEALGHDAFMRATVTQLRDWVRQ